RLSGQHAVLGQCGRGRGAHRPPPRHAIHHRPSSHHAASNAARPAAAMGRSAEGAGPRQAPERGDQGQRCLHAVPRAISFPGHLGPPRPRVRRLGFRTLLVGDRLDSRLRSRHPRHGLSGTRGGHLAGEVPDRRSAHLEPDPTRASVADRRREPEPRHVGGEKVRPVFPMSPKRREMHFGVFVLGTGNHSAGWRYDGAATSNNDLSVIQEIARHAERGKFDLLFVSDGLVMDPGDHPSFLCRFEPTTLISALSASTRYIGLGATVSTSFGEPYHVARTFGSIDHITKGRAAWNVVTSSAGKAALNFSREAHMEHDLRYEVAQEFVDVVKGLWDCWEDGAIVANKATGVYIDPSKVRPLDHRGRFFQVKGPVNMARCPQGHPVIIQAGGSEAGLELAARTADVVFSVVQELSGAKRAYRDLKGRMAKYGRIGRAHV